MTRPILGWGAVAALTCVWAGGCRESAAPVSAPARQTIELRAADAGALQLATRLAPLVEACYGLPVRAGRDAAVGILAARRRQADGATVDASAYLLESRPAADAVADVSLIREPLRENADATSREVYGLGEAAARVAVVSLARLGSDAWAAPWAARRARVVLHEAGHAVGLAHCDDPWCLMHDSDSLSKLDGTSLAPCDICWRRFCGVRDDDPAVRRAALTAAAVAIGLPLDPPRAPAALVPTAAGGPGKSPGGPR